MFVGILHHIHDAQGFKEAGEKLSSTAPEGMRGHAYFPSRDGTLAACLWEGPSVEEVREFIDGQLGAFAKNECYAVDEQEGYGLPTTPGVTEKAAA